MSDQLELEKGCIFFDAEEYFEAHEVWEGLWKGATHERRWFLQGMIQLAVAIYHAANGNLVGSRQLLRSGMSYLEKGRKACEWIDLDALLERSRAFEKAVHAREAGKPVSLPFFKLPVKR